MKQIKDSGARTEFSSGAVRDLRTGKGRMDLVPLDIANELINMAPDIPYKVARKDCVKGDQTFYFMNDFVYHGVDTAMVNAMYCTIIHNEIFVKEYIATAKELEVEINLDNVTAKQLVSNAVFIVSKHFENGTLKYGERNWEKGMDVHVYVDSGARHYAKLLAGFEDEPHHLAAIWNMMCAIWTLRNKPELNDLPCANKSPNEKAFK